MSPILGEPRGEKRNVPDIADTAPEYTNSGLLRVALRRRRGARADRAGAALRRRVPDDALRDRAARRRDREARGAPRERRREAHARRARLPRAAARGASDRRVLADARVLADEPPEPADQPAHAARDLFQRRRLRRVGAERAARDRLARSELGPRVLPARAARGRLRRGGRRVRAEARARGRALPELPRLVLALGRR